jgi:hypothetical protein
MNDIHVTPWMTQQATKADAAAPMHDCLWQIAQEQATLKRMQDTREDWSAAIDGSGQGHRNPHVVHTGESIKVRIDPAQLDKVAPGVTQGQPSQGAYNKAIAGEGGRGIDINKKKTVDDWIKSVPGYPVLPETTKSALIDVHGKGVDAQKLAALGGSRAFTNLDATQQQQLLSNYGSKDKAAANAEVDRLASLPPDTGNVKRLALVSSPGFFKLSDAEQRSVLERHDQDLHFREAVDTVVAQPNFKNKNDVEQATALDIMRRYTGRHKGYEWVAEGSRTAVLVDLYNKVLVDPKFNLNERHYLTKGDSPQNTMLNDFARDDSHPARTR